MTPAPIIVGGCHRSGTSLVRRILDAHPSVHCPPEVKFLIDFHGDYRDDPHGHARFFRTARDLVGREDAFRLFGSAFVEMHRRAAEHAGKPRWADKNPENVVYLPEWQRLLGDDWVLVHVIRDPRDVIASMEEAGFPYAGVPRPLDARLNHYLRYVLAGLAFGRRFPGRYREVRYEALVADPGRQVAALMDWLGEDFDRAQLQPGHLASGRGLEDPKAEGRDGLDPSGVGRWRRDLDPAEAELIALRARGELGSLVGAR